MKLLRRFVTTLILSLTAGCYAQTACTLTQLTGQTTHQSNLKWQASSASSVGYNVYRCPDTAANCGAPFTGVINNFQQTLRAGWSKLIGSLNSTQLSYSDTTVAQGLTYTYAVTAYDTSGNQWESGPSNVCTGTVPTSGGGTGSATPPPGSLSGTIQ